MISESVIFNYHFLYKQEAVKKQILPTLSLLRSSVGLHFRKQLFLSYFFSKVILCTLCDHFVQKVLHSLKIWFFKYILHFWIHKTLYNKSLLLNFCFFSSFLPLIYVPLALISIIGLIISLEYIPRIEIGELKSIHTHSEWNSLIHQNFSNPEYQINNFVSSNLRD